MILADLGAEVIKVEIPKKGDDSRSFGPYQNGESRYFANINRNKKGISLNLKSPKGKELFLRLIDNADIVVENYRPDVMDRLGLGYEVLSKRNPRLIYGSISGFGHYGPNSAHPGYDIIAQATSGIMSLTGWPGQEPTRVGIALGDILGGMFLSIGILAAINARNITGRGQQIDIALVDSAVAALETMTQHYFVTGEQPPRMGNRYVAAYPYDSFAASDGNFIIGCANQKLYVDLCIKVMKRPDLVADSRFATLEDRNKNHAVLKSIIEEWSKNYTTDKVVQMILESGVPAAKINYIKDIVNDPHIAGAREMFVELHHPIIGNMKVNGCAIKLSDTKPVIDRPAPVLGQDNNEIYHNQLGLSNEEITSLIADGII